jgi:hypothetical protein
MNKTFPAPIFALLSGLFLSTAAHGADLMSVYHDAAERPVSLQMADILDSQKDVIGFNRETARQPKSEGKPLRGE